MITKKEPVDPLQSSDSVSEQKTEVKNTHAGQGRNFSEEELTSIQNGVLPHLEKVKKVSSKVDASGTGAINKSSNTAGFNDAWTSKDKSQMHPLSQIDTFMKLT